MNTLMIKKKHKKQKSHYNRKFSHHIVAASTPMKERFSVLPEKNIITNYIILLGSCLYQACSDISTSYHNPRFISKLYLVQ